MERIIYFRVTPRGAKDLLLFPFLRSDALLV